MDKVLECKGEDVVTPGPIMEYMFEGKKHIYISDIYYAPYNLIIEVKDGGDNPNNRPMEEYRRKQVAKEEYIIKNTDFNYLRLTNNNFSQLLSIFAELKLQMIDDSNNRIIRINEAMNALLTGYIPGAIDDPNNTYIVNYMQNNVFSGFGVADNIKLTNLIIRNDKGMLENVGESFLDDKEYKVYRLNKSVEEVSNLLKDYIDKYIEENFIYETLTGHKLYTYDQILFEKSLQYVTSFKTYMNEFGQICRDYFGNVVHKEVEYNQDLGTYSLYSIQENGLSEMTAFSTTSFNRIINKNFSVLENLKYSIIDNM